VTLLKSGSVSDCTIQCHHLTVLGSLGSPVDCSGDMIIRSHGKIQGKVNCRHLRVERGARVDFKHPVTAHSVVIDGQARGQISCSGAVTLEKRAHFNGFIRATSLIIKSGAKHTGTFDVFKEDTSHEETP
jgi:cytoskeletal protein CcmA (bactofilin family)